HGLRERTLVSSTSSRALRLLEAADPELMRAISYPHDRYRVSRFSWPPAVGVGIAAAARRAMPLRAARLLAAGHASLLTLHHSLVSAAVVAAARSHEAVVVAWTVNDPARVAVLAGLGVAGIVTDDPGRAREALATLSRL